jgi:hypothetical protein
MNNPDTRFEEVLVDGQAVTIPTAEAWREIVQNPVFLGAPVYSDNTKKLVLGLVNLVSKHKEEFRLGMFRAKGLRSWIVLPLLVMKDRLQRVHIEHVTCDQCGQRAMIANPSEPSLYFGSPNELAATRDALKLPRAGCPNCCAPLSRIAAWVESGKGVSDNG